MQLVATSDKIATLAEGHRFVVNLRARGSDPVEVRSCEVMGAAHRNRFTFPKTVSVSDVFVGAVAEGVQDCLAALSNTTEVVSLPSVMIEIPGLSLARVNIMSNQTDDGTLGIILRFRTVLGGIGHAFNAGLGIEDSVQDYASHMSALVLTDLVLPMLDLCESAQSGILKSTDNVTAVMDTLIERSHELRFQAELIKRFVASAASAQAEPRLNNPDRPRIEAISRR